MVFCVAACDKDGGDKGDSGKDKNNTTSNVAVGFYVEYNSVKIELCSEADEILDNLGTPKAEAPQGECGGLGEVVKYTYDSIEIKVLNNNITKKRIVDGIKILDDSIKTPENITIGSTKDEVIKKCGKNYANISDTQISYVLNRNKLLGDISGEIQLIIKLRNGCVSNIEYQVIYDKNQSA